MTLDNQDSRATGATRIGTALFANNLLGLGEQFALNANATEGKHFTRLGATVPVNRLGTRFGVNASTMRYDIRSLAGTQGSAETVGVALTHPLARAQTFNLAASLSWDKRHLINESAGANVSDKRVQLTTLGLAGDSTDLVGGGGVNLFGVAYAQGKLDLSRNFFDFLIDALGAQRDGHFEKMTANYARLQRLWPRGTLWLSVAGQYAPSNLDPGEKFSLGGPNGVRAYPTLEGTGDRGYLLTVEYRHELRDGLRATVFYDRGWVRRDADLFPGAGLPQKVTLEGVGIGTDWTPREGLTLRAALATRLGSNPVALANGRDGDGTKRDPRLWVSATWSF